MGVALAGQEADHLPRVDGPQDGARHLYLVINCTREDTIRSFDELCASKWDHLPEGAFMYVGKIEEAAEKAERMAA